MRALVLVMALATVARAEPRKIDDAKKTEAIAHFRQGEEYFKSAQWEAAIKEYRAAYELTGEPLMIFDIALANEKAGNAEPAYDGYEQYLREVNLGSAADEARAGKARLQRTVDRIKSERAEHERVEAAAAAEAARHEAERREAARAHAVIAAREHDHRARNYTFGALGAVALGAISIGMGVKFGLDARAASRDVDGHTGPWTDALIARDRAGHDANSKMLVFAGGGAALIATGGVLYWFARREHGRAEQLRVAATPSAIWIAGRW
jgi:hypothetical protein